MDIVPISGILFVVVLFCAACIIFYYLKSERREKKGIHTEAFLQSVLQSVDNIVNYYEPMYDASGSISDFKIIYANECNGEYLGLAPEEIIGRPISEVFPFLFLNGEFEGLVECFTKQKKIVLHRQIRVKGEKMWFKSIVKPLPGGVCVTARNTTPEKSTEESLKSINARLTERNRVLSDTGSFLNKVMKSTPAIIAYLEPIIGRDGKTTDFEIIFASEAAQGLAQFVQGEMVGKNLSEAFPDFMENGVYGNLLLCVQTGSDQVAELEILTGEEERSTFAVTSAVTGSGVTLTLNEIIVRKD